MTVLLIDNYDSFTHNLFQLLGGLGAAVRVVRNDAITLEEARSLSPTHLVFSPGPGHPGVAGDVGICPSLLHALGPTTPTLGVCLGHQTIVHELGGKVVRAPSIVHGKTARIRHPGVGLFAGVEPDVEVMRYHSFVAERDSLPEDLEVTAETVDGLIMAVRHRQWPVLGVQFHPESFATVGGEQLLRNFLTGRAA